MLVRKTRRIAARARGLAVDAGMLSYRRPYPLVAGDWDRAYGTGEVEFYHSLDELPRYAILIGYLRELTAGCSVLDVGCGVGILRARLDGLPFERYVGVDVSREAIEQAQALADERTAFHARELPAPDLGRFGVAILNEMLYYAPEPGALLDEVAALLEPGGHVLTSIWRHPGDGALHRLLDARFERVAAVQAASRVTGLSWRVSCHRLREQG